ncbi:hypothetical protein [Nostoc sp.]|uniref:hypothetical protein n=1 Tax=Nostoc sp. TaxID=1180 RepID=UPI002A62A1C1|nr:hypothetical protein [Nostoc sp. S13]
MNHQRANTLKAAFQVCNVEPLEGADMERYYVDLSGVRKTSAIAALVRFWTFKNPQISAQFCLRDIAAVAKVQS